MSSFHFWVFALIQLLECVLTTGPGFKALEIDDGTKGLSCFALSPKDNTLAIGARDGSVLLWDLDKKTTTASWIAHEQAIHSIIYTPDADNIITGSEAEDCSSGEISVWSADTHKRRITIKGHEHMIIGLASNNAASVVASRAFQEGRVSLWDIKSGKRIGSHEEHKAEVDSVVFGPKGNQLASGDREGKVVLWDVDKNAKIAEFTNPAAVNQLIFSPDGKAIVIGGRSFSSWLRSDVTTWDVDEKVHKKASFKSHTCGASSICFLSGSLLASTGAYTDGVGRCRKELIVWDVDSGKQTTRILWGDRHTTPTSIAFSPKARLLVIMTAGGEFWIRRM